MDPHPPFDHPHHRRPYYPDHHHHHLAGGIGGGGGPAPARSRYDYDYDSNPIQYLPSDHHHQHEHHLPRLHHTPPPPPPPLPPQSQLPPPPPLPHYRHDAPHYAALPLRAPPETYSPPPYHSSPPHHHFRAADEIRRVPSHHHNHPPQHHHHQQPQHYHHQQPQLSWEEAEEERRGYAAPQVRLSPPDSRKRHRCALHDSGDLESTSSSGPPPRRQRQHLHTNYTPDDSFVDRTTTHPGYSRHDGFAMHSDSKVNRKVPTPTPPMLPVSPRAVDAAYPKRPQKSAPARLSVWQRIEENPSVYVPSSPHKQPKGVHISPSKTRNAVPAPKELASVISQDCKAKSADSKDGGGNAGTKKSTGKKTEKVLASVLVKPSTEPKEKERPVKVVSRKPDKVQNNSAGSASGSMGWTACPPVAGVKKVKKIVIKKIVRKIDAKDKQTSSSIVSEKKNTIDANTNASEKEEGEITTSSFEKDVTSEHNLVSTAGTAGIGSSVEIEKEPDDNLMNLSKRNTASATESTDVIDTASVSGSQLPAKEDNKNFVNSGDSNAASNDRVSLDSGVKNAALLCESGNLHKEDGGLAVSGAMNIVSTSSSQIMHEAVKLHECDVSVVKESKIAKVMSGNNADCADGVRDGRKEVSGSENGRKEDCNLLIGSNVEGNLCVNSSTRSPSTVEDSLAAFKDVLKKEGFISTSSSGLCTASLGDSVKTLKVAEPSVTQGAWKKEVNMLNVTMENDVVSINSWGTNMEISDNEDIQDKEDRIPTEPSEANASVKQHMDVTNKLKVLIDEDVQEKECRGPIESGETDVSMAHLGKARNTLEAMNENIQKKESRMPIDSSGSKITRHVEAPDTAGVVIDMFAGSEVRTSHIKSNGMHDGTLDNPDFVLAGATDDSCMQELLRDEKTTLYKTNLHLEVASTQFSNLPSSRNVESTIVPLDGDPMEDSSGAVILNNDVVKSTAPEAAELMHLQRADLFTENNLSLLHSHVSPSVSGNGEHSVPTDLTLGNNIYFSSAVSEGRPEENHKLREGNQGLDVVKAFEFGNLDNRKCESGNELINAGVQNWLALPLAVNYVNNDATVSMERYGLDKIVDEGTSVSQDHDNTSNADQCGQIDTFFGQDHSLKLCGNNMPQSDLLAPKERNKDVENESEIVLPASSVTFDQYRCHTMDKLVDSSNKSILLPSQSAGVAGAELTSSQVYIDPDHTYNSNTEDPVVETSTKPDLLSSWIEAIVSEAKKEQQPCKPTLSVNSPGSLLGSKEHSRKVVSDSAVKSPPRTNSASSTIPNVPTKQVVLPSSSREAPRLNQNARHRTWRRDNVPSSNSSLHASQPSGLPPKLPLKRNGKTQNSYIRKGNALIRNPSTANHPSSSSVDAQNKLSKPVMRRSLNFVRKVDSSDAVAHSNISVERPKTPPLPLHTKSISCTLNLSEPSSQTLQKQQVLETEKECSKVQVSSGVDNPSIISVQKSELVDAGKVVYVRPKSNQLVAAQGQLPGDSMNSMVDKVVSLQPSTTSDLYFKKRKNQIVLGSSTPDVPSAKDIIQSENSISGESKVLMLASSNKNITVAKDTTHRDIQKANTMGSSSHVWTLNGQHPRRKSFVGTSHMKAFPRILPWKRKVFGQNFRSNYSPLLNTSSLGIVRKLLQTRKRGTIYTVSTDGFSLRKSGVLSIGGSSLKWSRSLEKGSQKLNEEATLAVAEVERKKREKRKRQSLRNKGRNDQYSVPVAANQLRSNNQAFSDSRVSTRNEYVRINKGNQLVRNPKKVIRMLASEKVRWSLHTVRSRLAKKQQYCQFFTRFGECKKSGGKCPYIHDRAKVAICTKFLKGLCSNTSCKLTHKVLPERMPDCSYFLRGLCTHAACPYRHVKVSSNAPVCEDFLKGYCANGDECRKKHSYVCPVFEATGECPQQSRCKLHHPKKKIKSKRTRVDTLQSNSWGRYFDTNVGHDSLARIVSSEDEERQQHKQEHVSTGDFTDFIDLGADIDAADMEDMNASDGIQLMDLDSGNLKMQADNLDTLIKPLRIMRTARVLQV